MYTYKNCCIYLYQLQTYSKRVIFLPYIKPLENIDDIKKKILHSAEELKTRVISASYNYT